MIENITESQYRGYLFIFLGSKIMLVVNTF